MNSNVSAKMSIIQDEFTHSFTDDMKLKLNL